jgi:protein-S-isoprenylcysteine O-methyltransferase Ste14
MRGNVRSLVESTIDIGSGFILALLIQIFIFPMFNLYPTILVGIKIALIFTVVSILRSWFWRTMFNKLKG